MTTTLLVLILLVVLFGAKFFFHLAGWILLLGLIGVAVAAFAHYKSGSTGGT